MTLQRRVLRYLAVAAIASCALTVGVAIILVRHRIASQRLTALETQADAVAAAGVPPGDHVYRAGSRSRIALGPRRTAAVLAAVPTSGDADGTITVAGHALLFVLRSTPNARIVLVRSAKLAFAEWRPFLWSLVLAGVGGTLLALALSYMLAQRLTRPIGQLGDATRRLAAGEQGVTVPVDGQDELAGLSHAFNQLAAQLAQARESQRQFLESVSHELKTPLTSIRGYAEALDDSAVGPSQAGQVIASEADRLDRLVTDLLDLARFGRSGFSVAREAVDLPSIARAAVQRHLHRAQQLEVTLSSEGSPGSGAIGDPDRLLQATSNLVENALRLTPAGGSVTVGTAPGEITVSDTGPGLAEPDIPRAFDRFYLHDRYRSVRPVGSGLGLAIVKELVEAMGGSVEAGAADGGGARFTLRLPAAATPERSARPDAARPYA